MIRPRASIAVAIVILVALGIWQLQRRADKLATIAQVEARLAAAPIPAPGQEMWRTIGAEDAYSRVVVTGRYLRDADTRVRAVTALGGGYWMLTPLDTGRFVVLVNRGFVPADHPGPVALPAGAITVRGLLRTSEPGGAFLQANDPPSDRWTSRDVAAIAARRGVRGVAPYFIDADAGPAMPVGGLTTVRFANNHLTYALTWFALAGVVAVMGLRGHATRPRVDR